MFKNTLRIVYNVSLASTQLNFNKNRNIIIHHGLMGSMKNFRSISKNISFSSYGNIHLIDARNHGESPHTETHTIQDLADDLYEYIVQHKLNNICTPLTLMGHSMGAIALMQFTKKYNTAQIQKYIDRVILIDISSKPIITKPSFKQTGQMLKNMNTINLKQSTNLVFQQIDKFAITPQISALIKSSIVNVNTNQHKWKVNLSTLVKYYPAIGSYNLIDEQNRSLKWQKPVDLIYGSRSGYIDQNQIQQYKLGYKQMTNENFYKVQNAGHWVHFDQTKQFLRIVDFILSQNSEK